MRSAVKNKNPMTKPKKIGNKALDDEEWLDSPRSCAISVSAAEDFT